MRLINKLILGSIILATSGVALAQHRHHHGHRHFHHQRPVIIERDWVAPLVLGGIAGAIIVREANRPVIIEQPPVQVIPRATIVECTEWKEIMNSDGQVYKERTCTQR